MRSGPILVVEDMPNVLELLEVTLRFKGYQVVSGHNGVEGLEMVEKAKPALIITDILMPLMDGYAFVQKLRTSNVEGSHIPVIFLSATYVTPEDKEFALSLGATRFMEKPIETEEFLLTIAELMTQEQLDFPEPITDQEFYKGYRERLEQKLRNKDSQIARTERLIPTLAEEQRTAYESMLQIIQHDRENINNELQELYRTLNQIKSTGK